MARTPNGKAVLNTAQGAPVVALDILAKLSGSSAQRVARVLAAMQAVAQASGLTLDELANLDNAPTAAPDFQRGTATAQYYDEMQEAGQNVHRIKHL